MGTILANDPVKGMIRRILLISAGLALALCLASFALNKGQYSLSIAAGTFVAMASFVILVAVVLRSINIGSGPDAAGRRTLFLVAVIGCLKLVIIGAVLWWLISRGLVTPMAFLAGFTTMVVSLLIEGARSKRWNSSQS